MNTSTLFFESGLGSVRIIANEKGITRIDFAEPDTQQTCPPNTATQQHLQNAKQQLLEYFSGNRKTFDLTLNPAGTPFQKQVWAALNTIAFGETCTYKDIAIQVNRPKGSQAIGQANGKNPISIVVPCHRVIGSNGKLTGYAGGLNRKARLLEWEQQQSASGQSLR